MDQFSELVHNLQGNVIQSNENSSVANQPWGYAGYVYDRETMLYYLQARYYHSENAIFISKDPYAGDWDNLLTHNGYNYVDNNPNRYSDPSEESKSDFRDGELGIRLGQSLANWL